MSTIQPISPKAASRLSTLDPGGTVFAEFTALAIKHNAVNLGQGFPTLPVPEIITKAASNAVQTDGLMHQYTRSEGHIRLAKALSSYYSAKLSLTTPLNPLTEILTTVGASEAISSTMQAFINPGDDVILFQPFYDSYPASITLAGGTPVIVSLSPPKTTTAKTSHEWKFDITEIRKKITPKTKMIVLNNPHNPIGKVFTRDELLSIASIAEEFDLLVLADEVYEELVYSDSISPMIKFASLPNMYNRTITIGSAGKSFGITGWKVGWVIAPPPIIRSIYLVHQFVPFTVATPLQEAVAVCFEYAMSNNYFESTREKYRGLRDKLIGILSSVGLDPTVPHGGYFILADTSKIDICENESGEARDVAVCKYLTKGAGVTPIPPSAFYEKGEREGREVAGRLARFAFCKTGEMLEEAGGRLKEFFGRK